MQSTKEQTIKQVDADIRTLQQRLIAEYMKAKAAASTEDGCEKQTCEEKNKE